MNHQILPSLLSADLTRLGEEVIQVQNAGIEMIHFDVMDGHYVPNLTLGPFVCEALTARFKKLKVDVHLMASPVDELIHQFAKARASRISIHPDGTIHLERSLKLIRDLGCQAGLVLNPGTSPECLQWVIHRLDFVLVMTVNPGFAGQTLIPHVLEKIRWIHNHYPKLPIAVDGGINQDTILEVAKTGASEFVAGSAIFNSDDYKKTIAELNRLLASVKS